MVRRVVVGAGVTLGLLVLALLGSSQLLTDYWWFRELGYGGAFLARAFWQGTAAVGSLLAASLFFYVNLRKAKPIMGHAVERIPALHRLTTVHLHRVFLAVSVVYGAVFAVGAAPYWLQFGQALAQVPFGVRDPVFHKDLAFFFFTLPALKVSLTWAAGVFAATAFMVGLIYAAAAGLRWPAAGKNHVSFLVSGFVLVQAAQRWLSGYDLLYSSAGSFYGAGFTDVWVRLWAFRLMAVLAVGVAAGLWFLARRGSSRPLIYGLAAWLAAGVLFAGVVPQAVQNWVVSPNEYERERPYLDNHIRMTRQAYGVDDFQELEYHYSDVFGTQAFQNSHIAFQNVRLWDPRPILLTYKQLQEMRPYYSFYDADVDRYTVDGQYREVLLSVRELDVERISNRTWINQHLQYTHGYGLVMSPVNEITRQRLPQLWISDIPPRVQVDLDLVEPRIYFGEVTNQYIIVNSKIDEFDYPLGDGNAFNRYDGKDGVRLSTFLHRLAFALRFGDSRIVLSRDITRESRVLYDRNILSRAGKLAPFLRYDNDPYPVLHNGRIYWMIDAYTTSWRYPYALPTAGWGNYVRNSVKVVVDAYNGTIDFYQVEPDPLLESYSRMFPGLIKPGEQMPEGLSRHMRYPEDLLLIQSRIYGTYHMTNTRAFYNREDAWELSREIYGGREQTITPYYVVMRLPGSTQEELVLMVPYSPLGRSNMIAWLGARSDGGHYGEVLAFKFPKDTVTLGPAQIEARIDQDPEISQLLTLWGQGGSQVIRGNLLVLPVGNSILYVEPLYLQSEQTSMPQLQRIIVADQSGLVIAADLATAVSELLGMEAREGEVRDWSTGEGMPEQALAAFRKAQAALQNMDFTEFGEAWQELGEILEGLNRE
ncbi:MAG: hypothetical protein AA931_02405 [Peptococcaceae bacterium 1109]|nr:MAG: hypothetical protein AA931_02405 [Peptococcaceae bacterium 1109]